MNVIIIGLNVKIYIDNHYQSDYQSQSTRKRIEIEEELHKLQFIEIIIG